ncbi:MAG: hypothetical protein QOH68_1480 [Nocardioidaceae bacterium]|nr:hypothetical protein [Nocardioidaceae bacterium]
MSRRLSRLTATLAVGATVAVAGCGNGSSGGAEDTDGSKGALVAGVSQLAAADVLTTTLQLDVTPDQLQQLAESSGDDLSTTAAEAISSGRLVIETTKDKTFSLTAVDGGKKLLEIRVVDNDLYLKGDLQAGFELAGNPDGLDKVKAQAARLPDFVGAFINGDWVSLDAQALSGLAGSFGATATSSPSGDEGPQLLAQLRRTIESDITVKEVGTDSAGDHVQLSGDARALAADLQEAIQKTVPGGAALAGRLDASTTESRTITLDAWVNDGALSKLSMDLAQFDDNNELPEGTKLPIVLTFEQSGHTISAPAGATPVDLSQLGPLLSGFAG